MTLRASHRNIGIHVGPCWINIHVGRTASLIVFPRLFSEEFCISNDRPRVAASPMMLYVSSQTVRLGADILLLAKEE